MAQGSQFTKIKFGAETSAYGTETGSYAVVPRVQNFDLTASNNLIYDWGLGEGANATNTYFGVYNLRGSIGFDIVDFDFLEHWVGPKSGAGTVGDKYTLTEATNLSVAGTDLQPFSITEINDLEATNTYRVGLGCCGLDFSLSGTIGTKLNCVANFIGQKDKFPTTGESYTPNTNPAFTMINGTWKWGATPSALSGVRTFSVSYFNDLVVDTYSIESRFLNIPILGVRRYTGTIGIIMAQSLASTIITNFYSNTSTSGPADGSSSVSPTTNLEFKIEFVNNSQYANVWLDHCSIDDLSKPVSLGGGLVILNFSFTSREGKGNAPITWWSV